jgi:hypothetical protein
VSVQEWKGKGVISLELLLQNERLEALNPVISRINYKQVFAPIVECQSARRVEPPGR